MFIYLVTPESSWRTPESEVLQHTEQAVGLAAKHDSRATADVKSEGR